ncbi:MAG: hypothetical protein AAB393_07160 [Bacteroidota bacterium]
MKKADLLKMLGGGDRRSIGKSEEVVAEVLADARLFDPLFNAMLADDPLVRMRAADAVEKITTLRPEFLVSFKSKLVNKVAKIDQQEVRWHVAQMFSRLELSKAERRTVVKILKQYLNGRSSIVRTFSMQALADIAWKDGTLRPSILRLLEKLTEEGTPAMKSRGRKLLARLKL